MKHHTLKEFRVNDVSYVSLFLCSCFKTFDEEFSTIKKPLDFQWFEV